MQRTIVKTIVAIAMVGSLACKSDGKESAPQDEGGEPDKSATTSDTPSGKDDSAAVTPKATPGFVSFKLDGEAKRFEFLDAAKTKVIAKTINVNAAPEAGSKESLNMTLSGFDPRKGEFPHVVKRGAIAYESADGGHYGGIGEVTLESFDGGVLEGKVDKLALPGVKGTNDKLELSELVFEATL